MPTLSVKLADSVKTLVDAAAADRGITAHAFMVDAIEQAVRQDELHRSFMQEALKARDNLIQTGLVYDGGEAMAYFRAKMAGKPVERPRPRQLASYARRRVP